MSDSPISNIQNELVAATETGSVAKIRQLVQSKVALDSPSEDGRIALVVASNLGLITVVRVLLTAGANPNVTQRDGNFPLAEAARNGHIGVVRVLLSADAMPEQSTSDGSINAFIAAAREGHLAIIKLLYTDEVDEKVSYSALSAASVSGHVDIVRYLLDCGISPNNSSANEQENPLSLAVVNNHSDVVKLLLNAGADIDMNHDEMTPLHRAFIDNNKHLVQILVDAGADPNLLSESGYSPIEVAFNNQYTREFWIKILLSAGSVISGSPDEWDHWEYIAQNKDISNLLITNGIDPLQLGRISSLGVEESLISAAGQGYWNAVNHIIATENVPLDSLRKARQAAIKNKHLISHTLSVNDVYLLRSAADGNVKSVEDALSFKYANRQTWSYGSSRAEVKVIQRAHDAASVNGHKDVVELITISSLPMAVRAGRFEDVQMLIKSVLSDEIIDFQNSLYYAVTAGYSQIVELLLDSGADPNNGIGYRDYDYYNFANLMCSPLTAAVLNEDVVTVRLLIERDADPNDIDDYGYSPLTAAAKIGNLQLVKMLIEAGANPNHRLEMDFSDWGGGAPTLEVFPLTAAIDGGHKQIVIELISVSPDTIGTPDSFREWSQSSLNYVSEYEVERSLYREISQRVPEIIAGKIDIPTIASNNLTKIELEKIRSILDEPSLDEPSDFDKWIENIAHKAALSGRIDVVRLLVDRGVDLNFSELMTTARSNNHNDIVDLLSSSEST